MNLPHSLRVVLGAALLVGACDVANGSPAATEANSSAAAPQPAATETNSSAVARRPAARGCGRHGAVVVEAPSARPLPELTGRVVDMADLLPGSAEQDLVGRLAAVEAQTRDQLVVVTIPSLEGEPIESLGLRLGNGWGIGQAGLDNGVLLIVAPRERSVRIEVGCGLEGLLTDERARRIIDEELVPRFRERRYVEGVNAGITAIISVLQSNPRRPQPWPEVSAR